MEKLIVVRFGLVQDEGVYAKCRICFANYTGKTIKYMYVGLEQINRVGDVVDKECFKVTGPFYANDPNDSKSLANSADFLTNFILSDGDSINIVLEDSEIEYTDGDGELLDCAVINRAYKGVRDPYTSSLVIPKTITLILLVACIVIWLNAFSSCIGK